METQYEFGKETRELEVARILRKRRNARRAISISVLLFVAVLLFAFRNNIQDVLASGNNSGNRLTGGAGKNREGKAAVHVAITRQWDLPAELLEISGLSYLDAERVACVQDEEGIIFIYNLKSGAIEKRIRFGGPGDYEGLAIVGENAWVLRSDGKLFEVASFRGQPVVKEFSTPLTAAYNTEGLCFDQKNNRLLIALKDGERGSGDQKGIYSFDLATGKMQDQPVVVLDMKELFSGLASSGKKENKAEFMPSAITIHPETADMYITEGRKPRLLILDASGDVKKLHALDKSVFNQPEGITFSPAGELYISNEGSKKPGNILQVRIENK